MTRDEVLKSLPNLADFFQARADMAVGDGKLLLQRWADTATAAAEMLKELEPRLLTLDKVVAHYSLPPVFPDDLLMQEDYCMDIKPLYFDFKNVEDISFIEHWRGYSQVRQYLDGWKKDYGRTWVCWTDVPTDEQRKAVKWDG